MVKTLRESKAKLSELVERASRGEDVLITVRGKPKARLTRAVAARQSSERRAWIRQLAALQRANSTGKVRTRTEDILEELRRERA